MSIDSEQIQALKAAAQLIAHGYQQEWGTERDEDGESTWVGTYDHDGVLCPFIDVSISEWSGEDGDDTRLADFIAKANPVAILSLLAERDADKALIAEQAKRIAQLEISCDRNYVEGMKTGWNYCDAGNSDGFNTCVEQREKDIRDARTAGITLDVGE